MYSTGLSSLLGVSLGRSKAVRTPRRTVPQRLSLWSRLFSCQHTYLSLPFSDKTNTYRKCLHCGARRNFNPQTFETYGAFYRADEVAQTTVL